MRRAMNISSFDPNATQLHLKICFSTGEILDESFDLQTTTFADVKLFAIQQQNDPTNEYKLISIGSKRIVDENRKLSEENLRDGDEFLLMKKTTRKVISENNVREDKADALTIETRTKHLPISSQSASFFGRRRFAEEFRTGINRILISLIETSQKLLWFHPDAEGIFRQAEEILLRTSDTSTETNAESRGDLVRNLTEMGFTERQAQLALKRTNNDVHAATDLLLNRPDSIDEDEEEDSSPPNSNQQIRLYNRHGPFVSIRKFQEETFRLNSNAVRSLKEMGFDENQIGKALRMFRNNKNLACEYLLSDENQQNTFEQSRTEQTLDPNSRLFQTIVQNAVVQRMLNLPKVFFVLLQLTENAGSITNFMNDPDIAQMLVEISRIYHSERDESSSPTTTANSRGARQQSDETTTSDDD